jgi:alkyldihydroxyacetonephosphate synthase
MSLKREQIADTLKKIVGEDRVVTDEQVLKESSVDRFRRFEAYHGVYRLPLPAAVVHVNSSQDVAASLNSPTKTRSMLSPEPGTRLRKEALKLPWKTPLLLTDPV